MEEDQRLAPAAVTQRGIAATVSKRKKQIRMRRFKDDRNLCKWQTLVRIFSLVDKGGILEALEPYRIPA